MNGLLPLGRAFLEVLGGAAWTLREAGRAWWEAGPAPRRLAREGAVAQAYRQGWRSMALVAFTGLLIGGLIHFQAMSQMSQYGLESYLPKLQVVLVVRELGPLLTALLLLGRSGAAMATELGLMGLSEELPALRAFGMDPRLLVVAPRILGAMIALLCLTVVFDLAAVFGGLVLASARFHLPTWAYAKGVFEALTPLDLGLTLLKGLGFGALLSALACTLGLRRHADPLAVAQATDAVVVSGFIALFTLDLVLAVAAYG